VLCSGELEFAGHVSQTAVPGAALCVPAAHCEQVPPLSPAVPATHVVKATLCIGDSEFAGQASHTADPVLDLYVPVAHCKHVPPFRLTPDKPGLHWHSDSAVLAVGLFP